MAAEQIETSAFRVALSKLSKGLETEIDFGRGTYPTLPGSKHVPCSECVVVLFEASQAAKQRYRDAGAPAKEARRLADLELMHQRPRAAVVNRTTGTKGRHRTPLCGEHKVMWQSRENEKWGTPS